MCSHISNKTAYQEPVPIVAESVEPATVPEKETKKDNNSDSRSSLSGSPVNDVNEEKVTSSYSKSSAKSEEEQEVYNETTEKTGKGDVEITGGLQLYKLTDADKSHKTRFKDICMVNRHASSLTLT